MNTPSARDTEFSATLEPKGWRFAVSAAMPILQAAGLARFILPSSCRNGTCRTCMCRLTAGKIRYEIEWPGLSAEEKAEGWILPCIAYAESDLVIHAPAASLKPTEPPCPDS